MRARRFGVALAVSVTVASFCGLTTAAAAPGGTAPPPHRAPSAAAATPSVTNGYATVARDGGVFAYGHTHFFGSMAGKALNSPVVGMAATPDGAGYWLVASDGGIFAVGNAGYFGSMGGRSLNSPVVGMAASPDGKGYWLVASDGGVFAFGDAGYFGSMGGTPLNAPVVAIAATFDGSGYWLVAADGGVFAFGGAGYSGSMGGKTLGAGIVGAAPTPDGKGYWLAGADGGVFAFGDATFTGSMGANDLGAPVVSMSSTPDGRGYWLAEADGGVFAFGDADFAGSTGGRPIDAPMVGMAAPGTGDGCDVLLHAPVGHDCLLPWPNDAFTVPAHTPTGRQLAVSSAVAPANIDGVHVDTTHQNDDDGFSPGSEILTYVPNLSLTKSGIATSTDIGSSLDDNAPVVLWDTVSHTRVPYFAELDARDPNPASQLLLIHPAVALTEGHRYAVALRNLVDTSGNPIPPLATTTAALDGTLVPYTRSVHVASVIRNDLGSVLSTTVPYQAWDFTVVSEQNLTGPARSMHTQAYQWLATNHRTLAGSPPVPVADYAPAFTVTSSTTSGGVRDVHGTFQVPLFLRDTTVYSGMTTDAAGNPVINGNNSWTANFICVLPSTVQSGGPATPTVYGHGLLGSAGEVEGGSFSAGVADNLMGCATDWVGMSENDVGNVVRNLNDMSTWSTQVDHMLQGFVNFQFLGRLINSPDGFVTDPAFQDGGANPLFKTNDCHFMGYSQGGIMGGAVSAVSTEWTRVILGVPGMDYGGLLLQRSVDWDEFAAIFDQAYTNPVDEQLVLQLAQLLWDRGENEGYAEQLVSNTYPGIPAKQVFIIENYGDHQVANVSAEMLARTIGASNHQPAFNASFLSGPDRLDIPVTPQWGLPPLDQTNPAPAGLVLWDYGTPTPPTVNLAPESPTYGDDPHGFGRGNADLLAQITTFLSTGVIPNECGSSACQSSTP